VGTVDITHVLRSGGFALGGLLFGSFLTVVVHRTPRRQSIVAPRSACPGCGAVIRARDNVPVVSYLLLGGKCRACRSPIAAEYPLIEAVTAALFVCSALVYRSTWVAAIVAAFLGVMVAAAAIDVHHRIIPNRVTYPSLAVFAALLVGARVAGADVSLSDAAIGLAAFGGSLLLVAVVSPRGMGMGDVKLAALIGMVLGALGIRYVAVAALAGVLAGGAGGVVALVLGRSRKDTLPFGPFLAAGAVVSALLGPQVAGWYAGLLR